MATNTNASTPAPGTGGALGSAASSIASLLSDGFTIDGTQDQGETRKPSKSQGNPEHKEPEGHEDGEHPDEGEHDEHADSDEHSEGEEGEHEREESEEHEEPDGVTDETKFTVPVDGKDETVTFAELKKGYLRQSDYTRKTQAIATERQTIQREQGEARQERAQYKQGLEQVAALAQQLTPKEPTQPEWDALHAQDPQEWMRQREYWRSWKEQQSTLAGEYQRVNAQQRADMEKSLKERFADEGKKLKEAIPEWEDPKLAKAEKDSIREYAYSMGYSSEDVNTTVDHRVFIMARKAMLYDKLMKTKGSLKPSAPPQTTKVVRPGTQGTKPSNRAGINDARQRLAKTGNIRDAASLLEKLI